jgi:hypothetical protein
MADRPSRRAGFPFLRGPIQPGLPLLRRALRRCLSGAAPSPRPATAAAAPVRRPAHSLTPLQGSFGPVPNGFRAGALRKRHDPD